MAEPTPPAEPDLPVFAATEAALQVAAAALKRFESGQYGDLQASAMRAAIVAINAAAPILIDAGLAAGRTAAAADPLDTLDADELLTATNGIKAYIRLCGSRMLDDHPLHRVAVKLAARVAENGADRG